MNPQLLEYVKASRAHGSTDATIKTELLNNGWAEADIDAALAGVVPQPQGPAPAAETVSAYNPSHYAFLGFFLGYVPIYMMSMANVRSLKLGAEVKKRMQAYLAAYVLLEVAALGLVFWAARDIAAGAARAFTRMLGEDPMAAVLGMYGSNSTLDRAITQETAFAQGVLDNVGLILLGINLILLILAIRYANAHENAAYKALKQAGRIKPRGFAVPTIVGIVVMAVLYYLPNLVIKAALPGV